jgi:hypothetical protein
MYIFVHACALHPGMAWCREQEHRRLARSQEQGNETTTDLASYVEFQKSYRCKPWQSPMCLAAHAVLQQVAHDPTSGTAACSISTVCRSWTQHATPAACVHVSV